jgi:hypothetical protein
MLKTRFETRMARLVAFFGAAIIAVGFANGEGHIAGFDTVISGGWLLLCALVISSLPFNLPRWEVLSVLGVLACTWIFVLFIDVVEIGPGESRTFYERGCLERTYVDQPGLYKITPDRCEAIRLWGSR